MDIVTHGMMGIAIAGPILSSQPVGAAGFILGSVAPDLDVFGRCFGKRAFLNWHQGITHSLISLVVVCGTSIQLSRMCSSAEITEGIGGFFWGSALHVFLDLSNTYGVRALAPLSTRRFCGEWLFFVDLGMILLTIPAFLIAGMMLTNVLPAGRWATISYLTFLGLYLFFRGLLRLVARHRCPSNSVAIIPSAFYPWKFLVSSRSEDRAVVTLMNVLTGQLTLLSEWTIFDDQVRNQLNQIPEFRTMCDLSPAYHVVEFQQTECETRVRCRDLRITNFETTFGMLDVTFDSQMKPVSIQLHI